VIIGIGIDVVQITRMSAWLHRPMLLDRYFHPDELEAAKAKGSGFEHSLAARFAAKEAFGKALGTGLAGMRLRDIEVVNDSNGKPGIRLYGAAKRRFVDSGGSSLFVSLTHESDNAIAVVVIEGVDTPVDRRIEGA
jgi:holo-[acyl-carrier protein] synthase